MKLFTFLTLSLPLLTVASPTIGGVGHNPSDLVRRNDTDPAPDPNAPFEIDQSLPVTEVVPVRAGLAPAAPAWLQWTHNWKVGSVTGDHLIRMSSDGNVRFKTHFHAGGLWGYKYAEVCGLRDLGGQVYTLERHGSVHGTLSRGSRNHDVDETKYNALVKQRWEKIRGSPTMSCKVKTSWDFFGLLKDILDLVKKFGPIVGEIVKLFG